MKKWTYYEMCVFHFLQKMQPFKFRYHGRLVLRNFVFSVAIHLTQHQYVFKSLLSLSMIFLEF